MIYLPKKTCRNTVFLTSYDLPGLNTRSTSSFQNYLFILLFCYGFSSASRRICLLLFLLSRLLVAGLFRLPLLCRPSLLSFLLSSFFCFFHFEAGEGRDRKQRRKRKKGGKERRERKKGQPIKQQQLKQQQPTKQ